jgi:predicted membrane-bound spermidine synthase
MQLIANEKPAKPVRSVLSIFRLRAVNLLPTHMTLMTTPSEPAGHITRNIGINFLILLLFMLSGVAALIYQVCWQRSLFSLLGVDLESTTIVVSVFMFGLGCGALLGGRFADAYPERRILGFAVAETAIGIYGYCSPHLIQFIAANSGLGYSHASNLIKSFAILIVPTTLMGATLPILVTHLFAQEKSIGVSVGKLYFANTMGGAIGAALATFYLFMVMGISDSVRVASAMNVFVAATAYGIFGLLRR